VPDPLSEAAEELAQVLLPRLRERLRESTAWLRSLGERSTEELLRDQDALARLESVRADVERLGWCLGLLGAAGGADLLGERRRRDGLRLIGAELAAALDRVIEPAASRLPRVRPQRSAVWGAPFLVGWLLLQAARFSSGPLRWRGVRDGDCFWFLAQLDGGAVERVGSHLLASAQALGAELHPGVRARLDGEWLGLALPLEWLD
jgi:hypothetical protein